MTAVSLTDAKLFLNLRTNTNDAEVVATLEAAEAIIAGRVGPLEPTTVTETVTPVGTRMTLAYHPVIQIVSVTRYGYAVDLTGWSVSPFGVVTSPGNLAGEYAVTYQAGREPGELPPQLAQAVKELTDHLWKAQRGPTARPGQEPQQTPAYLLPPRVEALLTRYELPAVG